MPSELITEQLERNYRLIRKIGSGAFGQVHLYEQRSLGGLVAVKRVRNPKLSNGKPLEHRMLRSLINCPERKGIVWLHESLQDRISGEWALVLGYCNGGDLNGLGELYNDKEKCRVPEAFLWHVLVQVSQALAFIHHECTIASHKFSANRKKTRIVHRDVKPDNILLNWALGQSRLSHTKYPEIKLTDFGIAVDMEPSFSDLIARYGAKDFTAPEFHTEKPFLDSGDIWGLGTVIHFLAFGVPAMNRPPHVFEDLNHKYSKSLSSFVHTNLLRVTPSNRMRSNELVGKLQYWGREQRDKKWRSLYDFSRMS